MNCVKSGQISLKKRPLIPGAMFLPGHLERMQVVEVDFRRLYWQQAILLLLCSDGLIEYGEQSGND